MGYQTKEDDHHYLYYIDSYVSKIHSCLSVCLSTHPSMCDREYTLTTGSLRQTKSIMLEPILSSGLNSGHKPWSQMPSCLSNFIIPHKGKNYSSLSG